MNTPTLTKEHDNYLV